ncbi:MAG: FapA family protein, partial [Candidatus Latescibacterota bacterium]
QLFGYLGAVGRLQRLFVVSPVWVARDRMTACYAHLQSAGHPRIPADEEIDQLLALAGVRFGVDHRAIGVLLERLRQGLPVPAVVTLATGSQPVPGQDGRFEFAVDRQRQPGFIRPDGSIDFKQLALAPLVEPGQLVGTRHPARPGRDGMDVLGRPLTARPGLEVTVDLGKSIRLLRQEDQPDEYRAEIKGELVIVERTDRLAPVVHLAVHQVLSIPGDVDYRTGNIEYPGSVHVTGAIRSGFTVKAGGNLIVGDSIEDAVVTEAGGNLVVAHGISGSRTRVTTGGAVFAKFINEARVHARGDLNVAEYLLRAAVRADGELVVWGSTGRRASGLIAGGMAMAGKAIRAAEIGTEASGPTQLVAGVDSALLGELVRLQTTIDQHQEVLNKILRSLQAERLEATQLRQLLLNLVLRATGERRRMLAKAVRNLLAVQAQLQELAGQRRRLEADLEELAAQAEVRVSGRIAPNTVLKIGTQVHRVGTEGDQVVGTRFTLGPVRNGRRQIQLSTA